MTSICIYCCGDHLFTACPEPRPEPVVLRPVIQVVALTPGPDCDITPEEFEMMQRTVLDMTTQEPR